MESESHPGVKPITIAKDRDVLPTHNRFRDISLLGTLLFSLILSVLTAAIVSYRCDFWFLSIMQTVMYFVTGYAFYRGIKLLKGAAEKALIAIYLFISLASILWHLFLFRASRGDLAQPLLVVIILFTVITGIIFCTSDLIAFLLIFVPLFWYIFMLLYSTTDTFCPGQ